MTIQNLRYIIEIARCHSISKAAKSLFMTQSAISNAVKETEAELGIQIFNRTSHGVTLTFDGEDFLPYCKEVVAKMDYIQNRYQNRSAAQMNFSVSCQYLPFAVRAYRLFLSEFQDTSFELSFWELPAKEIFQDVNSGRSELGVFLFRDDQVPEIRKALYLHDLAYTELAQPPVYVFLNRKHPLSDHAFLTPEDLSSFPYITLDYRNGTEENSSDIVSFPDFKQSIHVCDRHTKLALLKNSDAFCIDTELYIDLSCANINNITAIPLHLQDRAETVHVGYITSKKRTLHELSQRYIQLLTQECQSAFPEKQPVH